MKRIAFLFTVILVIFSGCQREENPYLMTVNGPVSEKAAGRFLSHEHLLVDFIGADSTGYHRWSKDSVIERVLPFLEALKPYHVSTFVECTPAFLGRDPLLWAKISDKTGMHIITNTGFYGAMNNKFIPGTILRQSPEEIAGMWISEFNEGIEGTGIRPGFIKIGVDSEDTLSSAHQKLIRAAAMTHLVTDLTIASHTGPDGPAFEQLEILQQMEVDPSAFIWVHAQSGTIEGVLRAARSGAWISLDNVNAARDQGKQDMYNTSWYADRILRFKEEGLLNKVLISHDAGWYSPGQQNGGDFRGYTDLFTKLIPELKKRGFSESEIDQLLVSNPFSAFSINPKK